MAEERAATGFALYLLRHADAGDPAAWAGSDDERPLSKRGRKQARRLGRHLADLGADIDAVLTSPKVRAADTAKVVAKAIGVKAAEDVRLAGGFDAAGLGALLGELDGSATSAMLVGHDPDLSEVASWLTDAPLALRKGALARIDLAGRDVAAGSGTLRWLLPPDALRG
jgi:phosphohistidine phosphatase